MDKKYIYYKLLMSETGIYVKEGNVYEDKKNEIPALKACNLYFKSKTKAHKARRGINKLLANI